MPVRIETLAEPIPGYRLVERLGGGGFGEVWKAEAPGGLFKAIKFVFGDLQTPGDDEASRAEQELKALSRVKSVRHPYILSLERFDIIDGQLMIVMELADRTLWDRYRECRGQGLPGIPRAELLGYLQETAEALDLMNSQYQLQHLDIKPQNLFLVFNHVKVADFGLVKDLEGRAATVTGGVTPVYAAPETFDGWVSRFSDQYSLAIVYQELLTGQRPFSGTTIRQLVMQHIQGAPDLSSLLLAERPVIARALSKNPDHRFPNCSDFILALRAAVGEENRVPSVSIQENVSPPSQDQAQEQSRDQAPEEARPLLESSPPKTNDPTQTRNARGPFLRNNKSPAPLPPEANAAGPLTPLPPRPRKKTPAKVIPPQPQPCQETPNQSGLASGPGSEVFRPALVLGLGQLGQAALRCLRKELNERFGGPGALPHLRMLYLDTDPQAVQEAQRGRDDGLLPSEVLLTPLHRPSHYLKTRDGEFPFADWFDSRMLYRIPRQRNQAGLRPLGRLAFVDNYRTIAARLQAALAACSVPETLEETRKNGHSTMPRVYLVTALAGGTGSGMFLDLAYLVRRLLREGGQDQAEVIGLLLLPGVNSQNSRGTDLANTLAALTELNYFGSPETTFTARYEQGKNSPRNHFQESGPAFHHCLLVNVSGIDDRKGLTRAGQFLLQDLTTPLGKALDEQRRQQMCDQPPPFFLGFPCHTFGLRRLVWPRHQLLYRAAYGLCSRLVQHWMNKDSRTIKEAILHWAAEQWENQGFRPENLIAAHQERCEQILKQPPEKRLDGIFADLSEQMAQNLADPTLKTAPLVQALDQLDKFLGLPEDCRDQAPRLLSPVEEEMSLFEKTLQEATASVAGEFEQKLAELVVGRFEEPAFRLAGAEEAVRQFQGCVQNALKSQESLLRELRERATGLYQRLRTLIDSPVIGTTSSKPSWKAAFSRKANQGPSANEVVELVRSYGKARLQSLVLHMVNTLYVRLRGYLSDQMREIGFCRHRLSELAGLVKPPSTEDNLLHPGDQVLLPPGCATLEEAVGQLENDITAPDLLAFDAQVQGLVQKQFRALVHVCMATSSVVRTLAPLLFKEAEAFLQPRLENANVAGLFLERYPEDDAGRALLEADLHNAFDEAAPPLLPVCPEKEICLILVPAGPAGDCFRDLARQLFPTASILVNHRVDEIVIYRGLEPVDLADLEQTGTLAQEAYRQRTAQDPASVHSRTDISDWRLLVPQHS